MGILAFVYLVGDAWFRTVDGYFAWNPCGIERFSVADLAGLNPVSPAWQVGIVDLTERLAKLCITVRISPFPGNLQGHFSSVPHSVAFGLALVD